MTKKILRQKCVNCDKTNFTTKQHKLCICGDIFDIAHMRYVEKFQISPHLAYGEISDCSTIIMHGKLKFLHMANVFSAYPIGEIGDKYQVCFAGPGLRMYMCIVHICIHLEVMVFKK